MLHKNLIGIKVNSREIMKNINLIFANLVLSFFLSSCGGGGGSDGEGNLVKEVTTGCGVVKSGSLINPFPLYDGEQAVLEEVVGTTILKVRRTDSLTSEFISIYGLSPSPSVHRTKIALWSYVGSTVYLVKPESGGCTVPVRGVGSLESYQVITDSGINLAEFLVKQKLGRLSDDALCGQNLFGSCVANGGASGSTQRFVGNFLWKPNSESPYNKGGVSVILNPCDVDVYVNGQEVMNYGPGNGRCITARSPHPGCHFGTNIEVKIIDKVSGLPVKFGTNDSFTVPNGCARTEFAGTGEVYHSEGEESDKDEKLPSCVRNNSDLTYRPSWAECGGNAGVLMKGEFANAFNSALRMPDNSDRLDPACKENGCSPYKTQGFVDMVGGKIACYGAPGNSPYMSEVVQVSVKREGTDRNPYRECLDDPSKES